MKNLILIFILLLITVNISFSQKKKSCCDETTAPNTMASFGSEQKFKDEHPIPAAFTLIDAKGKMITFNTGDGKTANAYEVKSDNPSNKWILVFHEWYGLNDYIKKESDDLSSSLGDVNVLALDLYDGNVATNNDEAVKYMQSVTNARAFNIIHGAADYAGSNAIFGTIGWCFGGGWSLQAAIELGAQCKACVMYYGVPEENLDRLAKLKAPVLGNFGLQDTHITPDMVSKFELNLKTLGIPSDIKEYDAVHGFANPSNPKHDPIATQDAKERTLNFFKDKLK
jgi:carboxymethylenebutenolidase